MIYFIQEVGNDKAPIKIGYCSGAAISRLASLQTGYPAKLCVIGERMGSQRDEAAEHERWKHLRVHGEWFRADPDLIEHIRAEASSDDPGNPHRSEASALAQAVADHDDYEVVRTGLRKQCPRCWKMGWVFHGKMKNSESGAFFIVWDGSAPWGNVDIADLGDVLRPTAGCGYDEGRVEGVDGVEDSLK